MNLEKKIAREHKALGILIWLMPSLLGIAASCCIAGAILTSVPAMRIVYGVTFVFCSVISVMLPISFKRRRKMLEKYI